MKYRVALASYDGQYVDHHFGHAYKYYIYEFDGEKDTYEYIEKRFVDAQCECHDQSQDAFADVFDKLSDTGAIVISRIGPDAIRIVESNGYVIYESDAEIKNIVESIKENRLFEVDKWREVQKI
ncbi:MAG: hypothetical protein J6Z05_05650 [Lachnospiraceae bacterium]|nr:hypothetical protein [Lachnospiraceae bacterium]